MTGVDWAILAFTAGLAVLGYVRGFIVGVLSVAGLVAGGFLGTRLAPLVLSEGNASPYAPVLALAGAVLGAALLGGGLEGLGLHLRQRLRSPAAGVADGVLGALLTAGVALVLSWVLGAVALTTPGAREWRRDIQRSEILRRLNDVLPPSGPILNALARFDPFPRIEGPEAGVAPPRAAIARDRDVRRAAPSVVRVLGTACGLGVSGSGWVAGSGLVVTNAHVVAGQDDTAVQAGGGEGPRLDARAVAYDPRNDVAVLAVDGLEVPALELSPEPEPGEGAAILGFPRNGAYDVRAARIGPTRTFASSDAYGAGPVRRSITTLRGTVRPGNSGGPVVDASGQVATTIFAAGQGTGQRTGYGVPNRLVRRALDDAGDGATVSTGPCAG